MKVFFRLEKMMLSDALLALIDVCFVNRNWGYAAHD